MMQKLLLCAFIFLPLALSADNASELTMLNKQIEDYKQARDETKMKADIAGRNADRIMSEDWTQYRHELERQEQMEQMVRDMDTKIADLQARKAKLEAAKQ